MGYNSSGLNIVLERLLLATRRPSTHYPLASGAAFFDPLRAICRRATNHLQHTAQHLATPPASHLPSFCAASAISPQTIRHLAARHPLAPCRHLLARTDALNGPQNKPSAQAGALNPCKNTFCVIVNCPGGADKKLDTPVSGLESACTRWRPGSSPWRPSRRGSA